MKKIILVIVITILCGKIFSQERGVVVADVQITEDAINLFLTEQYNKPAFKKSISGTNSEITYKITLMLPRVSFQTDVAKIHFGFKIESNILNQVIEVEDNISFRFPPSDNLSIKGISQSFTSKINALNINSVLKNAIIGAWNGLELELYPMKLAKKIDNSEWLYDKSIYLIEPYFSVRFIVLQEKLRVYVYSYLEGREMFFVDIATQGGYNKRVLGIKSNKQAYVKKVEVFNTIGQLLWSGTNLGTVPKMGKMLVDCGAIFNVITVYEVRVLFESDVNSKIETFHLCPYKIMATSGELPDPKKKIN